MLKNKILVTGGAGFIGSNLCLNLSKLDVNTVYSLDNYFTGSRKNHFDGVNYIEGHTKDIFNLIDFIPNTIYHLGEYSRVEQSFEDIEKVINYNKLGTFKVLEFARKTNAKLIYAGSSTKFGDDGENAQASPYAWSKSSNTELVKNYGIWYNLNYAIVYFYNAYGTREISDGKYATLIGLFIRKMREGKPLTIVTPGTQRRNFTHVEDIVDALKLVADYGHGDNFGIGSDESFSIDEIAKLFGGEIEYISERRGNRMNAVVHSDKTKKLGWSPKRNLKDYIIAFKKNKWC